MHIAQTSKGSNGSVEIRPATLELARREPLPNPAEVFEDGMRLHHMVNTAYPIAPPNYMYLLWDLGRSG